MEKFQRETATVELIDEMIPTLILHEKSVSHYPDIRLNPDYEKFLNAERAGNLRVFTARSEKTGALLGYSLFFVSNHLHKRHSLQAEENALFIHQESRGFGLRFIDWTEDYLRREGVQVVVRHTKARPELNFAPMLERKGYKLGEFVFFKRLDEEAS